MQEIEREAAQGQPPPAPATRHRSCIADLATLFTPPLLSRMFVGRSA